ncbi:MAG: hypothetical protein Q4G35_09820 [Propionibacteriaceae bacterium]|nr:hypothetical protein [Propionibacteriaceae bacterium]
MRMKSWLLVLLLLAGVGVVSWQQAPSAVACSCAVMSTAEHGQLAELVAEGVVVGVDRPVDAQSSLDDATYTVELTRVWKGPTDAPQVAVLSAIEGPSCGWEGIDEGMTIALFAKADGDMWRSSLCDGSGPMNEEMSAELTTALGEPVQVSPATANSPAPDGDELPQDNLRLVYLGLGAAGVALVLLAVLAWVRQRKSTQP